MRVANYSLKASHNFSLQIIDAAQTRARRQGLRHGGFLTVTMATLDGGSFLYDPAAAKAAELGESTMTPQQNVDESLFHELAH